MPFILAGTIIIVLGFLYWACLSPTSRLFGKLPYRVVTTEKVVALTFDDGPNEPYTGQLLDILDRENVKATFFVVGRNVQRHPAVVKRAAAAGHTIGNHSLSHRFSDYFRSPTFAAEIAGGQAAITTAIGRAPRLFRSPWLFRQPLLLTTVRHSKLVPVSGAFGHSLEVFQPSAEAIVRATLRHVRPGAIIILHDGYDAKGGRRDQTVRATELLIKRLKADGYGFVAVDRLLGIEPYQSARV